MRNGLKNTIATGFVLAISANLTEPVGENPIPGILA
jgi:hypothetical protein